MNGKSCTVLLAAFLVLAGLSATAMAEVTFEWVTVGHVGNPSDPENDDDIEGIGSVGYIYRIAKHEVTNAQYAEFLNAVAVTDPNALYTPEQAVEGGISRSGISGSYVYTVNANMGNKPVNFISFVKAMMFVNWLHNGQPTGAQGPDTVYDGVYTLVDGISETRNIGATFFVPTENEWYKAAYHQPSIDGGDTDNYWLYPTASNTAPTPATASATGDISNPGANVANYNNAANWGPGSGTHVTTVGSAGALSESYWGTLDQGGNVIEWNEKSANGWRHLRGGDTASQTLHRWSHNASGVAAPLDGWQNSGFRLASPVPPSPVVPAVSEWGVAVAFLGLIVLATIVMRQRKHSPAVG